MKTQTYNSNTIPSSTPQAQKFFDAAQHIMCNLMMRWMDEHEYENIADYQKPLEPIATECGVTIEQMLKRPFGCVIRVDQGAAPARHFKITLTSRGQYSYTRIS